VGVSQPALGKKKRGVLGKPERKRTASRVHHRSSLHKNGKAKITALTQKQKKGGGRGEKGNVERNQPRKKISSLGLCMGKELRTREGRKKKNTHNKRPVKLGQTAPKGPQKPLSGRYMGGKTVSRFCSSSRGPNWSRTPVKGISLHVKDRKKENTRKNLPSLQDGDCP